MASVDIDDYLDGIHDDEDRPLMEEAAACAQAGALRAAYIMIWLACAESLKRRFAEAARRDSAAGDICKSIRDAESKQKPVDGFLLTEAEKYGLLSPAAEKKLRHVYESRCIYGHPYSHSPSAEEVVAAAAVVRDLLAKPVLLRHGFLRHLTQKLIDDPHYLADHQPSVAEYAAEISLRIDPSLYDHFLSGYWDKLEALHGDPDLRPIFRRGYWFSGHFLRTVGCKFRSASDWHEWTGKTPKLMANVFSAPDLFEQIGKRAQASLVSRVLKRSEAYPSALQCLERLATEGVLQEAQANEFRGKIGTLGKTADGLRTLKASGLSVSTCYERIIAGLASRNWYFQNPCAELIEANGPEAVGALSDKQQMQLGRNVLQAAEGEARGAERFLQTLAERDATWPEKFLDGLLTECFQNEGFQVRLKTRCLRNVLTAVAKLPDERGVELCEQLAATIGLLGESKSGGLRRAEVEETVALLHECLGVLPMLAGGIDAVSTALETVKSVAVDDVAAAIDFAELCADKPEAPLPPPPPFPEQTAP